MSVFDKTRFSSRMKEGKGKLPQTEEPKIVHAYREGFDSGWEEARERYMPVKDR